MGYPKRKCITDGCERMVMGARDICMVCHSKASVWKNKRNHEEFKTNMLIKQKPSNRFAEVNKPTKEDNQQIVDWVKPFCEIGEGSQCRIIKGEEFDRISKLYSPSYRKTRSSRETQQKIFTETMSEIKYNYGRI